MKNISDIDFISATTAIKILDIKHKSHLWEVIETYGLPSLKLSLGYVFLSSDVKALRDSEVFKRNRAKRHREIPRKNIRKDIPFGDPIDITKFDIVSVTEAIDILEIKTRRHFHLMVERYSIPYAKIEGRYIFSRHEIEKVKNSPERQRNLKHRKKK